MARFVPPDTIVAGDARTVLDRVIPGSVSLSFWSPPYFVGKSYEKDLRLEDWQALLAAVIAKHARVLKPGGFLAVNIADILAFPDPRLPRIAANATSQKKVAVTRDEVLAAKRAHPDWSRYQLATFLECSEQTVQRRLEGVNIRGGKYDTQTKVKVVGGLIEAWGESAGLYLYDRRVWVKDPAWANSRWHSLSYRSVDEFEYLYILVKPGELSFNRRRLSRREWAEWGSRGVWRIPSVRANDDHEAKFPEALARRVIRLLTDPGDLVLDCFVGSGTTAVAALKEARHFIGIDVTPRYVTLARRRVREARGRA